MATPLAAVARILAKAAGSDSPATPAEEKKKFDSVTGKFSNGIPKNRDQVKATVHSTIKLGSSDECGKVLRTLESPQVATMLEPGSSYA